MSFKFFFFSYPQKYFKLELWRNSVRRRRRRRDLKNTRQKESRGCSECTIFEQWIMFNTKTNIRISVRNERTLTLQL